MLIPEGCEYKWPWPTLIYIPNIFKEGMRESTKYFNQDNRSRAEVRNKYLQNAIQIRHLLSNQPIFSAMIYFTCLSNYCS